MSTKTNFKTIFNHDKTTGFHFQRPSLVQPQYGYECDINEIVKGCVSTLNNAKNPYTLTYCDTTTIPDLETASNIIATASSEFAKLPSDLRARFANDPKELLRFVHNKSNYDEAVKLGLITPSDNSSVVPATDVNSVTQNISGGSAVGSEPSAI